ncbi:MAG: ParB family transcriptional regulator, chromosome partitioning protein [Thermosediminibacterales bacterium]|nr:ParB family transcriptional regulator, chromosome partitioning protein [Thermosediminibacterales bacterium]MDK2835694.1 ParB family transcriptional regulator, chromosome partitioning protein [Thermosediminibacterales bacterium]
MSKKRLGKGLGALLPIDEFESQQPTQIKISKIRPNEFQPRKDFDEDKLDELAASIKEHGIIQPIVVRPKDGFYEIVAGERRWRAAQKNKLETVPAIVKEFSDIEMMQIALIENLQREDLNPIEEAMAFKTLMNEFNMTQETLSKKIGKSRSVIANSIRLLNLPKELQLMLSKGQLTSGHARALLSIENPEEQINLAKQIVENGLTVRDVEKLVKKPKSGDVKSLKRRIKKKTDPDCLQIEEKLKRFLGTQVKISNKKNRGKIEIEYYGIEDLNRIIDIIMGLDKVDEF